MRNIKNFTRIMGVVLVLAMVVSSFAMFAIGGSASTIPAAANTGRVGNPAADALTSENGVTFNDYAGAVLGDGSTASNILNNASSYIRDKVGMVITKSNVETAYDKVSIKKVGGTNAVLNVTGFQYYINANVGGSKNDAKYEKNSLWLDLINDADFAKKFSISMDLTINGTSGSYNSLGMTSDNGKNNLATYYRGVSAITVNESWLFKITSANLPVYEIDGEKTIGTNTVKTVKIGEAPAAGDAMYDKGYIYPNKGLIAIAAKDENDPLTTYSRPGTDAGYDWSNSRTGACITPEMMDGDGEGDALTYTLNKPFNVKFDIVKGTNGKATVDVYIDGVKLWQTT